MADMPLPYMLPFIVALFFSGVWLAFLFGIAILHTLGLQFSL